MEGLNIPLHPLQPQISGGKCDYLLLFYNIKVHHRDKTDLLLGFWLIVCTLIYNSKNCVVKKSCSSEMHVQSESVLAFRLLIFKWPVWIDRNHHQTLPLLSFTLFTCFYGCIPFSISSCQFSFPSISTETPTPLCTMWCAIIHIKRAILFLNGIIIGPALLLIAHVTIPCMCIWVNG